MPAVNGRHGPILSVGRGEVMETFLLEGHPHVELCDLLKLLGWSDSGASAKALIAQGLVLVDGNIETRKRCKILAEQVVSFAGQDVVIKA